jgi:hypothetical protein
MNVKAKTCYIDGELCGVDEAGLPSFAQTQAATDVERGVHLLYCAFDLLHVGWDVSIERKALLEPLVANKPGLQLNGHETGDGEVILKHFAQQRATGGFGAGTSGAAFFVAAENGRPRSQFTPAGGAYGLAEFDQPKGNR